MENVNVVLANGSFNGPVKLFSSFSRVTAFFVSRSNVSQYSRELNKKGVYLLFIGSKSIYVGEAHRNSIYKRIFNTHSGEIDNSWHSVAAFTFSNRISTDELGFIENALCEYVHNNRNWTCVTTSPSRNNCNEDFRIDKFDFEREQIITCNRDIDDIKHYISLMKDYLFVHANNLTVSAADQISTNPSVPIFCKGPRGADAKGFKNASGILVRKGSIISDDVTPSFLNHNYYSHRLKLIEEGVIVNNKFIIDYQFKKPSEASAIILGRASCGPEDWKTSDGKKLKEIIN